MKLLEQTKKLRRKYRPLRSVKKSLRKKKNQRRLAFGLGVVIILGLLLSLVQSVNRQGDLQQKILDNQVSLDRTQKEIKTLQNDMKQKQKILDTTAKQLDEKTKKQTQLEGDINNLNEQIIKLRSAYGGYGGGQAAQIGAYTEGNSYTPGNCTWGVKNWKSNTPNFWGNANQWDDSARAAGILVDGSPVEGAIAQTDEGWAGHVALVIEVIGNQVTIKEMNFNGLYSINTRIVSASEFMYIHI